MIEYFGSGQYDYNDDFNEIDDDIIDRYGDFDDDEEPDTDNRTNKK